MRSFGRRLPHALPFPAHPRVRQGPGGKKTTVAYRNRHVRCVRLLFRLLFKRGLILSNLAARIPEYRDPRKLSRGIMDKDQVTRLLQAAHLTTPTGFRDRTIFEVLYSTGLRGGELCKLTLYEVNLPERMLRVVEGKGRKDRVVPVGKVAASYLAEYIKTVRPILLADKQTPVVFVTAQGGGFAFQPGAERLDRRRRGRCHAAQQGQSGVPDQAGAALLCLLDRFGHFTAIGLHGVKKGAPVAG